MSNFLTYQQLGWIEHRSFPECSSGRLVKRHVQSQQLFHRLGTPEPCVGFHWIHQNSGVAYQQTVPAAFAYFWSNLHLLHSKVAKIQILDYIMLAMTLGWPADFSRRLSRGLLSPKFKIFLLFRIYLEQLYHCLLVGSFDNEDKSLIAARTICNGTNRFWNGELFSVTGRVKISRVIGPK